MYLGLRNNKMDPETKAALLLSRSQAVQLERKNIPISSIIDFTTYRLCSFVTQNWDRRAFNVRKSYKRLRYPDFNI